MTTTKRWDKEKSKAKAKKAAAGPVQAAGGGLGLGAIVMLLRAFGWAWWPESDDVKVIGAIGALGLVAAPLLARWRTYRADKAKHNRNDSAAFVPGSSGSGFLLMLCASLALGGCATGLGVPPGDDVDDRPPLLQEILTNAPEVIAAVQGVGAALSAQPFDLGAVLDELEGLANVLGLTVRLSIDIDVAIDTVIDLVDIATMVFPERLGDVDIERLRTLQGELASEAKAAK